MAAQPSFNYEMLQVLAGGEGKAPVDGALKNLTGWIIALQGTGDLRLNAVVNDLHTMRRQILSHQTPEREALRTLGQRATDALRGATPAHQSALQQISKTLQKVQ